MKGLSCHRGFVALAASLGMLCGQAVRADHAPACASLAGTTITAADIGLPTTGATVTAAMLVAGDAPQNTNGEYCLVTAAIHPVDPTAPNILIELNLTSSW